MQEQMNQNNRDFQQSQSAPQLFDDVSRQQAVMVENTNPKRIIKEIILRLRGVVERPDGTIFKVSKAKMNDAGIENISYLLESYVNQNVILSHLEEQEIRNLILSLSDDLVDSLALNKKTWGIENSTDLDDISNSILINVYMCFKRALGQNEKNFLSKISIENISAGNRMPSMKKDSFWSKFKI
jgi:hypothetical protein